MSFVISFFMFLSVPEVMPAVVQKGPSLWGENFNNRFSRSNQYFLNRTTCCTHLKGKSYARFSTSTFFPYLNLPGPLTNNIFSILVNIFLRYSNFTLEKNWLSKVSDPEEDRLNGYQTPASQSPQSIRPQGDWLAGVSFKFCRILFTPWGLIPQGRFLKLSFE